MKGIVYHYDLPQALEDEYGGWISRKIVKDFTAYADVCFKEFGDRVLHWTTLNEPNSLPLFAYDMGMLPPSRCSFPFGVNCTKGNSLTEPYLVAYHTVLAHASAVKCYRKKYQGKQLGSIGINVLAFGSVPLTNSTEDLLAAQRANDFLTGLTVNPLVFGDYPETVKKVAGIKLPAFTDYESKLVKSSFDFLGLNHYFSAHIKDNSASLKLKDRDFQADMGIQLMSSDYSNSSLEYPINPTGMQEVLEYFKQVYDNPPIYIHENGQRTPCNSSLEDTSRVKYMHTYIGSALDAIRNGSNTRGYFTWSFLDMLELFGGYETCFGLHYVYMDDPELKRYPKLSAYWYSQFLKGARVTSHGNGTIQLPHSLPALSATPLSQ